MSSPKIALEGQLIDGRFQIIGTIAEGGFGAIYLARQLGFERDVAVKFLHNHLIDESDSVARFEREAKALSSLSHKNLVACYAYGTWLNRLPYAVFELVNGKTLKQRLAVEHRIPWQEAFSIGIDVCSALSAAHGAGIIHRDLKPENIMVASDGTVKVLDFGLVHIDGQQLTQTGALVGSLMYMSPEQAAGKIAIPESDIYSLACVIYEAICGQPPLLSDNPMGLLHKHRTEHPQPLSNTVKDIPDCVENVLSGAMTKDSADRYPDAATFAHELKKALDGGSSAGNPFSFVPSRKRPPTLRIVGLTGITITAAATILLVLIGVIGALLSGDNLPKLIIFTATFDRPSQRAPYLEQSGDWLRSCNARESAKLVYSAAATNSVDPIGRIRRLDKLAKLLGIGAQHQENESVLLQSISALNALPTKLPLSEQDGNVLVSAVTTDEALLDLSRSSKVKWELELAIGRIEVLLLQNARFVQWISMTNLRQRLGAFDLIREAGFAMKSSTMLETIKRADLMDLFLDKQITWIVRDNARIPERLKKQYMDFLLQLKSGQQTQGKPGLPIMMRVFPWISMLGKADQQRFFPIICEQTDTSDHWNDFAAFAPFVGNDYKSNSDDAYHQSAKYIHACAMYKSEKTELAFNECCRLLLTTALGELHNKCIRLAVACVPAAEYSSPSSGEKLTRLADLIRVRSGGKVCMEVESAIIRSLLAQGKTQAAISALRTNILSSKTPMNNVLCFCSLLDNTLLRSNRPAENSFQKYILPKLSNLSRSQRNPSLIAICATSVADGSWKDIAALEPLINSDWQAGDDAAYRESAMFIRACSSYVSGKSDQSFEQSCQLVKTASNPVLLDNCLRLALMTLPDPTTSTAANTNEKLAYLVAFMEPNKERIYSYRLIDIYQRQFRSLQADNQLSQAVVVLRKIVKTLTTTSTPDSSLFFFSAFLEDALKQAQMPPEDSIRKRVIPLISRLNKTEQVALLSSICASYEVMDHLSDIAALKPLIGEHWQQSDDAEYRQTATFIETCSLYDAGKYDQAFNLCCKLVKTASNPLLDNGIRLALLAVSDPTTSTAGGTTKKLGYLAGLIEANKKHVSGDRIVVVYDRQFRSLQADNQFPQAVGVLRKIVKTLTTTSCSDVRLYLYYAFLEDGLKQAKMPPQDSVKKIVTPWLSRLSRSERTAVLTEICGPYATEDRWSDIAALELLLSEKSLPDDDAVYRQSTSFIQACSFYLSGQYEKAFDQSCQLITTASGPLLKNCLYLSLEAIGKAKYPSNIENVKFAQLVALIEARQPELQPCPVIDQTINTLIEKKNFPLALRLLRKIISGGALDSAPATYPLFPYYSLLEYCLNETKMPAENSIQRYAIPYISRLSRSDRITVLNKICAVIVRRDGWQDLAALEPLVREGWKEGDGEVYRQSIMFIQACSLYASGKPEQALENCWRLIETTRGGLLINCLQLSVSAIASARYPGKIANQQFARIERLVELSKKTRPIVALWSARIKNSIANQQLYLQRP